MSHLVITSTELIVGTSILGMFLLGPEKSAEMFEKAISSILPYINSFIPKISELVSKIFDSVFPTIIKSLWDIYWKFFTDLGKGITNAVSQFFDIKYPAAITNRT